MADFLCQNEGTVYEAVAYYRLSKYAKSNDSESIANQRKLVREYLSRHPEILLVDEQEDDGFTGTNYERPGFQAVMRAIREKRANCVIVKDLSRLGREYIETGKYLERVFPAMGVRFISINDDVDSERERAGDDIIIPVKNIMNEAYCRELSRKLRRQFEVQRSRGEYVGSFVSYGYLKDPQDKHKLIPDEYAAEVVRGIFQLKIKGYSAQTIADHLNENGVLSPSQYKKQMGSRYKSGFQNGSISEWGPMTIRRILTNEIYMGTLIQGKRGTPNYKIKQMRLRDESKWSVVPHNHEPIVDEMMFELVQRMLQRDTRKSPEEETVQPLSGIVFCADCMRAMCRRVVKRGEHAFYYYVCSSNKRTKECSSHSFSQSALERIVYHAIQKQIEIVVEMDKLLTETEHGNLMAIKLKRLDTMVAEKEREIENYQDFRMKLLEAFHEKLIDRDEYDGMRKKYTGMIEKTKASLEKIMEERAGVVGERPGNRTWVEQFAQYRVEKSLTREMAVTLVDKIYVYEDKRLKIEFNYRDEIAYDQELLKQLEQAVG